MIVRTTSPTPAHAGLPAGLTAGSPAASRARVRLGGLLSLVGALVAGPALAKDDFDPDEADEEEPDEPKRRTDADGDLKEEDPDAELKSSGGKGAELKLDDEDGDLGPSKAQGPGEDTAVLYRKALEEFAQLTADEEALAWERYLRKYPKSLFRTKIDQRLEEINAQLYQDEVESSGGRASDAGRQELFFAQPMQLESIDPRSRLRAGFEWGFPDWVNLMVGGEYQLMREWSVHGGLRQRYTGWNVEAGTTYALVKSARTGFIVSGIGDVRLNLDPSHFAMRPQLGVGKRFRFNKEVYLDAMVQGGSDLAFIDGLSPRLVGGANLSLAANNNLRVYMETSSYMKDLGDEQIGSFRFNQLTFGMKFVQWKGKKQQKFEAGFGANAPYTSNYWSYHYGSIMGDVNYYLNPQN